MLTSELEAYLTLYFISGIGAKRLIALREYFGSAEAALSANSSQLRKVPNMGKQTVDALIEGRKEKNFIPQGQIAKLTEEKQIITYFDDAYPASLKTIFDPPALLFTHGNVELLQEKKNVAVIGSRRVTDYGKRATKEICEHFAENSVVVTSGFARGVDTAAHTAAYESGGKTICVLGSGLDIIYPATNKDLAETLVRSGRGLLVSELPFGTPPDARNFPWRNRIVSGLAKGIVVIESDVSGGSMITATLALDQNREVFALPGDIYRQMSKGPNQLIRESRAKLILSGEDVLVELGWSAASANTRAKSAPRPTDLTLFENKIVDVLESAGGPLHIDALAERAEIEVQDILVQLLTLEFKNVVRQLAGKQFVLLN
jgi:DNA processing protein